MKKNILKIVLTVIVVASISYTFQSSKTDASMSDLVMDNVEALASEYCDKVWVRFDRPDGTGYNCTKGGSESCFC